ncbi:MAG: recombinase family protein [Isosphaerales bacterium]
MRVAPRSVWGRLSEEIRRPIRKEVLNIEQEVLEAVYDPATPNGRLILGLKGLIAEMELHTIKMRLHAGLINKARRGDLAVSVPGGLVRDLSGRVVQHPDQEVRERIAFVFATFLPPPT